MLQLQRAWPDCTCACRGRNKPSKFEAPREEDEEALEADLAPLASEFLRYVHGAPHSLLILISITMHAD